MMNSSRTSFDVKGSALAGIGALAFCLSAAGTIGLSPASAAPPRGGPDAEALQVIADVVLIESRCRQLGVDYGRLFGFADANGINPVDIMPAGARRAAFEAAYGRRARESTPDRLCGDLAAERAATIPGVFTTR